MKKVDLFIIDPQVDFCESKGNLYVKGAEDDMSRLSKIVARLKDKWNDIHVTLDSHHYFDVAHPIYWKDSKGDNPKPFTIITAKEVVDGIWSPTVPSLYKRSIDYVKTLEKNNRYPLCIWPYHCLIGSDGSKVFPELFDAFIEWEKIPGNMVEYVTKGSNPYTEHYSGLQADVPDPSDTTTQLNKRLIDTLEAVDIIVVAGEASSHCVANTINDLISNFTNFDCAKKIVLLEDAMSPVTGFEKLTEDFFNNMKSKGVTFAKTTDFLI
jgi:nicotinamidase/pyrazinamidase